MKIDSVVHVTLNESGYDVALKTETGNTAIAHLDESWVVQSVSRIDGNTNEISEYSVIPQPVREAVAELKNNHDIADVLLISGVWYGDQK